MTLTTIRSVGFCAHYSEHGDWAFDYALELSRKRSCQLNVFHFLSNPYDPRDRVGRILTGEARDLWIIEREKELRLYYDERAGEYLDVGFRLCEDNECKELHRCLLTSEFQVLVLPYPAPDAVFGKRSLEEFADLFISPVVLVGPQRREQIHLNSRAALIVDQLELSTRTWDPIARIAVKALPKGDRGSFPVQR